MDLERLIALVKERRPLWDQKDKNYHNRDVIKQLWKEISRDLGVNDEVARQKWRGMRDNYRRELAKMRQKQSEKGGKKVKSKWQYFDTLYFVRNQLLQKSGGNISPGADDSERTVDFEFNASDLLLYPDETMPTPLSSKRHLNDDPLTHTQPGTSYKTYKISNLGETSYTESEKSSCYRNCDDDYHFAMSTIPYMRQVAPSRKLFLRQKILQIIIEEQTSAHSAQVAPHLDLEVPSPNSDTIVYNEATKIEDQTYSRL